MRAIRMHGVGDPGVLRLDEVARPEPGADDVLIEVAAAGVTFGDVMKRRGVFGRPDLPAGIGTEVAGTVVAAGAGSGPATGTRVAAWVDHGYAEYAVAAADAVIPIPDEIDEASAATVPVHGVTAYQTLTAAGRLHAGQTVLVHAAAGGVGTLAIQLARLLGAGTVIGTAGSAQRLEHVRAHGADLAVDYSTPGWSRHVLDATDGRGADLVLESVGGRVAEETFTCLAPFATVVSFGAASGTPARPPSTTLMATNSSLVGYSLPGWLDRPDDVRAAAAQVMHLAAAKELQIPVAASYPLAAAGEAHAAIENRTVTGNVVLIP